MEAPDAPSLPAARLHHLLIEFVLARGFAPDVRELAALAGVAEREVRSALERLEADHGVVLHPDRETVWALHPFALAPTLFIVRSGDRSWWGNCAWCSLGVVALADSDAVITTTLGADGPQVDVHVTDGRVVEEGLVVHFPVPMRRAWDNVAYTCSTMLLFDGDAAVDRWCAAHRIAKGDVRPVATVWEFARVWYGRHRDPDWRKWTSDEARALFARFGLTGDVWALPASGERF